MEETTIFILFIIIIFIIASNYNSNKEISIIKSPLDNREYRVLKSDNELDAANLLASINNDVLLLIDSFKNEKEEKYTRLVNNFNPNALNENLNTKSYKAYSLNKGEEIVICIRNDDGSLINDKNTIIFVVIHELSHVMTKKTGHPPIFWENMSILLKKAIELNIYTPSDYSKYPVNYCGMIINNTPL